MKKIPILLVLALLSASILSLPSVFSNTTSAPYIGETAQKDSQNVSHDPIEDNAVPPPPDLQPDDVTETPTGTPQIDELIIIRMEASDVHRGNLILINYEYNYDIPEANDFVLIAEEMTTSYKVTGAYMLLSTAIIGSLNDMMDAFYEETERDNITIRSAFRDYASQQEILNYYISIYGQVGALRWASAPGHSEHHAGIAFDFGVDDNGVLRAFTNTGVNAWFAQNSWKYGFTLRYPDGKTDITGVANEPWHFRYVGLPHAQIMYENDWCLEEYIEILMEYTQDEPFHFPQDDTTYEIFYAADTEIKIPFDCEYEVSGNNIEGFIVTLMLPTPARTEN